MFDLTNFQRNTQIFQLYTAFDEVGIKNVLKILFENTEMPFCQKSDIEKCIYNKLNDEIINSYFKLLENRKTDVISFSSFLFHDLCKSKVSSLLKMYLKHEDLLEKRSILIPVNQKNQH